jgi:hypothetical protein
LTIEDLKRLDDLCPDRKKDKNDTLVYEFIVDKRPDDGILVSSMVFSDYVESHFSLPEYVNDIVVIRTKNRLPGFEGLLLLAKENKILRFPDNSGSFIYDRSLTDDERLSVLNAVSPSLTGYEFLPKKRCVRFPHSVHEPWMKNEHEE